MVVLSPQESPKEKACRWALGYRVLGQEQQSADGTDEEKLEGHMSHATHIGRHHRKARRRPCRQHMWVAQLLGANVCVCACASRVWIVFSMDPDIIGLFCCLGAYQQTEGSVYCRTREGHIPVILLGRTLIPRWWGPARSRVEGKGGAG